MLSSFESSDWLPAAVHWMVHNATNRLTAQRDFEVVASCSDGTSCVEAIRNLAPDVVLLEELLPKVTGAEILAITNAERLSTRLVFFAGSIEHGDLVTGIAASGCSVISKHASPTILTPAPANLPPPAPLRQRRQPRPASEIHSSSVTRSLLLTWPPSTWRKPAMEALPESDGPTSIIAEIQAAALSLAEQNHTDHVSVVQHHAANHVPHDLIV